MTLVTIPNRPANKSPEKIVDIIANFDAILTVMNGLLDDDNIANLGISLGKLKASGATLNEIPVWGGSSWISMKSALLAFVQYKPASPVTLSSTSLSYADIDATNLIFSFKAPPSGKVLVTAYGDIGSTANRMLMNLRDGGGDIAGTDHCIGCVGDDSSKVFNPMLWYVTGLTSGTTYNWKLGWKVESAGTNAWRIGDGTAGDQNPAYIKVEAVA